VPTFCRHGRLLQNCPICSKREAPPRAARAPRPARARTAAPGPRAATGLKVRRVQRAVDDGYDNELAGGLRATADAARLAEELAFSAARLDELRSDPPGLYAEVAGAEDVEEAAWLAFLIAYLCPLRGPHAFDAIDAARVPWASGARPELGGVALGPRSSHDPARGTATIEAYRAWTERSGGQAAGLLGEPDWSPERRFARIGERLRLPGLTRAARFELLTSLGALGVVPLQAGQLALGREADPVLAAAKRVFGIGDAINLERRAAALAAAVGVPLATLDLALHNWSAPLDERATMGARTGPDEDVLALAREALGIGDSASSAP
jgi:hypothetical protein